jgi:hypothetical protein
MAADQVRVDQSGGLHQREHAGRPDEGESATSREWDVVGYAKDEEVSASVPRAGW